MHFLDFWKGCISFQMCVVHMLFPPLRPTYSYILLAFLLNWFFISYLQDPFIHMFNITLLFYTVKKKCSPGVLLLLLFLTIPFVVRTLKCWCLIKFTHVFFHGFCSLYFKEGFSYCKDLIILPYIVFIAFIFIFKSASLISQYAIYFFLSWSM